MQSIITDTGRNLIALETTAVELLASPSRARDAHRLDVINSDICRLLRHCGARQPVRVWRGDCLTICGGRNVI